MNIVLLNSDLDDFVIMSFVVTIALLFFLKWVKDKFKAIKFSVDSFQNDDIKQNLDNYTFNFENNVFDVKAYGIKTKLISILVSLIIVAIPLYEFIETLKPQELFIGWTCFP